jgi:hypothetical protein
MLYKDFLLCFMCICYAIPIYYVYYYYNCNNSVSNIICNENSKNIILFFMILMGYGTLLYELERSDLLSTIFISLLLVCLYGLILFNESNIIHYVFAYGVFMLILGFMLNHCIMTQCNFMLTIFLIINIVLLFTIIIKINENIFYSEVFYILIFAIYYIFLHFI